MKRRRLCNIVLALLLSVAAYAQQAIVQATDTEALPADTNVVVVVDTIIMATEDSAELAIARKERKEIYQGTTVKLDILSPLLVSGLSHWTIQHYEVAVNVRLANRFYPTFEVGYSGGQTQQGDSIYYNSHGGFFRAGADINPLKRNPGSPHALLIGLRLGAAFQPRKADCWGEIVAGCQVEICKVKNTAFYMGWMGRFKILFTREAENLTAAEMGPIYIPGFGHRSNLGWGASYHLGWKF
ncbi:MAG: hypothetical protein IKR37_03715 [Paludibacteraceae bacterium]|nr:hypothetical protein [Paludibacteraceae bacterium]MBR6304715.1 hypothetical protein [Paludibacteraceae bacterium]